MFYEANVYQMDVDGHIFWIADSKVLNGCTGQGESSDEAIKELEENEKIWLNTAKEFNIPIPPRTMKKAKTYSGKVSLRMSPYVHENAAEQSNALGVSLNQFINDAIVEYTAKVSYSLSSKIMDTPHSETISNIIKYPQAKKKPINVIKKELEEM